MKAKWAIAISVAGHVLLAAFMQSIETPPVEQSAVRAPSLVEMRFVTPKPKPTVKPTERPAAPNTKLAARRPVTTRDRPPRLPKSEVPPKPPVPTRARTGAGNGASGESGQEGGAEATDQADGPAVASGGAGGPSGPHPGSVLRRPGGGTGDVDLNVSPSVPEPPGPEIIVQGPPLTRPRSSERIRPKAGGGFVYEDPRVVANIEWDGSIELEGKSKFSASEKGFTFFDLTETIMEVFNDEDPLRHHKARAMAQTRELRAVLRDRACRVRLFESVGNLRRQLDAIWTDESRSLEARRRVIFDLWDECAEEGTPEVLEASRLARATIYSFIRAKMPAGSPDAYGDGELHALNARRTARRRFAPYARSAVRTSSSAE